MLRQFLDLFKPKPSASYLEYERGRVRHQEGLDRALAQVQEKLDYSNVTPPDPELTPILAAARWVSHDLHGERMPAIAADLMEAGYDTPALIRLAGETMARSRADVEPLVGKMFKELGVPWPLSQVQAKLIATRQIAREVIYGKRNAFKAASHLEIVLWGWRPLTKDLEFLFALSDELSWDTEFQRYIPAILADQFEVFKRLAALSDNQILNEAIAAGEFGNRSQEI